jgi:hypothetical protein
MQDEADAQLKWVRENMRDAIPDEAFPERMKVFSRHRKMTFNDHVNRDPVDWCDYIRKDTVQAWINAAVKAERERCRKLAAARADYLEDAIHNGSGSKTLIASMKGGMIELRLLAAAIRKGEQP